MLNCGNQKGGTVIAAPPSLQLEPYVRDQCLKTEATTPASTRAIAAGTAKRVFIAIEVVFISLTSGVGSAGTRIVREFQDQRKSLDDR
jgi:hypothetical protein